MRWPSSNSAASCFGAAVAEPFTHRLRVRYAECDAQGVVFNAHYLAYVDHTITELWRAAFGRYQVMLERGVDIVVAEAHLTFLGGARFDEEIDIDASVTHLGTTSMRTLYQFRRGDRPLLSATLRHVFVTAGTTSKTPIPDWARDGLAPWFMPELDQSPTSDQGGSGV
jgi:acyl-CoA thioester hydrolase